MGEKEIRPAGGDAVVRPRPATPLPQTTEKHGTGDPKGEDPNTPQSKEDFEKQVAESAKQGGGRETLYKDGWSEGHDGQGNKYAIDPNGVRGNWDAKAKQYVDPKTGKAFPKNWGTGHQP